MPLTTDGKNVALDGFASNTVYCALFNGDPSGGGVEITGGSYARQQVTWNAASGANLDSNGSLTFSVPASSTVNYLALYSALTGGTLYGTQSVPAETFTNAGQFIVNDIDITLT